MLDKYKVLRTAEKYVLDRKFAQAVGEYRKLLAQDPEEPSLLNTVGDLLVRQQQTQEALDCYRRVAEIYLQGGFAVKALAMYKKILSVEPGDSRARETVADLYEKQGLVFDAARELRALVDIHESSGRDELALNLLKKLTAIVPDDPENWARRARLFARRGDAKTALGQFAEAIRLYRVGGDFDGAFEAAREALSLKSSDHVALNELVQVGDQSGRLAEVRKFLETEIESTGKAYPFQMFLGLVREKEGALEEAGEIFKRLHSQGFSDPIISQGLVRTGQAVVFDDAPGPDVELPSEEPGFFPGEIDAAEEFSLDSVEFTEDAPEFSFPPSDSVDDLEPPPEAPPLDAPGEIFSAPEPFEAPEGEPEPGRLWEIPLETESAEEIPAESSGLFSAEQMGGEYDVFSVEPPLHDDLFAPEEVEFEEFEDESLQVGRSEIASLEEALEEVDFYLKLGFRDDGKQLLEKLLVQFPGEERVLRRARKVMPVAELAEIQTETAPLAEPALKGDFEDEIENALGGLFAGAEDEEGETGEEVLRYEVAQAAGQESANPEVHYNLGLAYKEMGLIDDAIQEFLKVDEMLGEETDSPQRILSCSMLANSYLQIGDHRQAARWAREGLKIPDKKDFERKALEYDLAAALEGQGQLSEAMNLYHGILSRDESYRDVAKRADRLRTRAQ